MEFKTDVFKQFDKDWALVCAGDINNFNMMTISWGGLGTLWNKPVCTVYVRKSRYTHEFMDNNEYFTVNFISAWDKNKLRTLGTKSGRDMDKMHDSGLRPMPRRDSVIFWESDVTLICRKLFVQTLDLEKIPADVREKLYAGNDAHDMYIGEVVEMLYKDESLCNSDLVFKSGHGTASNSALWKVCHDRKTDSYTAEVAFGGAGGSSYSLYEINKEIYDAVGTFPNDEYESEHLIETGRHLYMSVNDKCGQPYEVVHDKNYKQLCPWSIVAREE